MDLTYKTLAVVDCCDLTATEARALHQAPGRVAKCRDTRWVPLLLYAFALGGSQRGVGLATETISMLL